MDFENDPAAEFLQREREELADIIHENESEFKIKRHYQNRNLMNHLFEKFQL